MSTLSRLFFVALLFLLPFISGCGVYSFSGASIEGKSMRIDVLENRARNIVPTLSASLTEKIRNRILSQTGLDPVTSGPADYEMSGYISTYEVTVSGIQNTQQATQNRLTISVSIDFKNHLNEKGGFKQTFTRFADFNASQSLASVENDLINQIGTELADDIFNKAFVNW
jgi:hypothetical protein